MLGLQMPSAGWVALAVIQAVVMLLLTPLFTGFSRVMRAKMHSRKGPGILQDYRDVIKLLRRQSIAPATSGVIFAITPVILVITMLLVAMSLPTVTKVSPFPISGDIITDIYLFAIFRFFFSLSGVDSGSMFAGMGGSRELTLGILVEPIFMLSIFIMAMIANTMDLGHISLHMANHYWTMPIATILAGVACAFVIFIEMGKLPFDCAEAEQELQEGPLTEYSGSDLGLMKLGLGLKQLVVAQFFLCIFFPWGKASSLNFGGLFGATILLIIKLFIVFFIAALLENSMARVRFVKVHRVTWIGFAIAVLALVAYWIGW